MNRQGIRGHNLGPQALGAADCLPETARAYAFAERPFHRVDPHVRVALQRGVVFRRINESSIRARHHQVNVGIAKFVKNLSQRFDCLALLAEICSGHDLFKANIATAPEQKRARSFAQDRASRGLLEGFDRRR